MQSQEKILANNTWHYFILGYFLKDKEMKEVVPSMDKIIEFSTQEIIKHNKCQMRSLDKIVLTQKNHRKLMINVMTCSMLESPSTSDNDEKDNGVSKSTVL